jgi:hypothetical protein
VRRINATLRALQRVGWPGKTPVQWTDPYNVVQDTTVGGVVEDKLSKVVQTIVAEVKHRMEVAPSGV